LGFLLSAVFIVFDIAVSASQYGSGVGVGVQYENIGESGTLKQVASGTSCNILYDIAASF
jgi:hypothetical protein